MQHGHIHAFDDRQLLLISFNQIRKSVQIFTALGGSHVGPDWKRIRRRRHSQRGSFGIAARYIRQLVVPVEWAARLECARRRHSLAIDKMIRRDADTFDHKAIAHGLGPQIKWR